MKNIISTTTSLLFCFAALWITPLHAGLIGVTSPSGDVYGVDTTTGAGTLIGSSGLTNPQSLARDPFGTIFTVEDVSGVFSLATINPITGAGTVGPTVTGLGSTLTISGLAFSPGDILFASVEVTGLTATNLYTINTTTGAATLIGNIVTGCCDTDLAFSPGGTLYGWNLASNTGLMTINTSTGAGTVVQAVATPLGIVALTFDASGNLFGVQTNGTSSNLYAINTSTSGTTLIGTVGSFAMPGIAFAPAPVPEPGTLRSALGGLLLLTAIQIVRRNRERAVTRSGWGQMS